MIDFTITGVYKEFEIVQHDTIDFDGHVWGIIPFSGTLNVPKKTSKVVIDVISNKVISGDASLHTEDNIPRVDITATYVADRQPSHMRELIDALNSYRAVGDYKIKEITFKNLILYGVYAIDWCSETKSGTMSIDYYKHTTSNHHEHS